MRRTVIATRIAVTPSGINLSGRPLFLMPIGTLNERSTLLMHIRLCTKSGASSNSATLRVYLRLTLFFRFVAVIKLRAPGEFPLGLVIRGGT